jgi:hypothetical protein
LINEFDNKILFNIKNEIILILLDSKEICINVEETITYKKFLKIYFIFLKNKLYKENKEEEEDTFINTSKLINDIGFNNLYKNEIINLCYEKIKEEVKKKIVSIFGDFKLKEVMNWFFSDIINNFIKLLKFENEENIIETLEFYTYEIFTKIRINELFSIIVGKLKLNYRLS